MVDLLHENVTMHEPLLKYFLLVIIGTILASCARTIQVPASDYESVDSSQSKYWRVTTDSSHTYWVEQFSTTDSTLVIEKASKVFRPPNLTEPQVIDIADLPIVLQLGEVTLLERREPRRSTLLPVILTIAVASALMVWQNR
jgi:hypothetical protein